jgi:hypothetical protein
MTDEDGFFTMNEVKTDTKLRVTYLEIKLT